jgi:predicted NACHT family NTPase
MWKKEYAVYTCADKKRLNQQLAENKHNQPKACCQYWAARTCGHKNTAAASCGGNFTLIRFTVYRIV